MALNTVSSDRLSTNVKASNLNSGFGQLGNRNKIINGSLIVSQRGTSETGINGANEGYRNAPDRFKVEGATFGTHTVSQSTDSPNGFSNSYKVDCTTANTSLSAGSIFEIVQKIEGQNLQDFAKGTSDAKQYALSFHVKTTKTGTYVVVLQDEDNTRICSKTYTVSDTNWNKYELIFPADTTGAFGNDNNASLSVRFVLVAGTTYTSGTLQTTWANRVHANTRVGQVNFADSTSNDWYLTGVQLEVGSEATDFEHRSFAEELALCQRYYYRWTAGTTNRYLWQGQSYSTTSCFGVIKEFPVTMRAVPTSTVSGTFTPFGDDGSTSGHSAFSTRPVDQNTVHSLATGGWDNGSGVGGGGRCVVVLASGATDYIDASAEL